MGAPLSQQHLRLAAAAALVSSNRGPLRRKGRVLFISPDLKVTRLWLLFALAASILLFRPIGAQNSGSSSSSSGSSEVATEVSKGEGQGLLGQFQMKEKTFVRNCEPCGGFYAEKKKEGGGPEKKYACEINGDMNLVL